MNTRTGLWIDHDGASVVVFNGAQQRVRTIQSNVISQPRRGSDTPTGKRFDAHHIAADATRFRTHESELRVFFDRVLAALPGAGELLVLGPGRAKGEFLKHLRAAGWAGRLLAVEPAEKMSDRQLIAVVREYFRGPREPHPPAYRPWYTSANASRIASSSLK